MEVNLLRAQVVPVVIQKVQQYMPNSREGGKGEEGFWDLEKG